ncbi:hypothetical protein AYI69_g3398 [Smittium culicis]|uniref:Uncharacterized protein n=1 Tax=Smittium culicis TaxID=133412 RepID=A0A1R1YK55_9FUNG|nr:hypothetical protein AYI69_g5300 [Smittium culicis]OMJ27175.1 hypothetical protein AYI69_g3398 [Smittium culicis]
MHIDLSFSSAPEAIKFCFGWHATHNTTSVCPTNFCTICLFCRFQIYTHLSSLPLTIYFPAVVLNDAKQQYIELACPLYVFKHLLDW